MERVVCWHLEEVGVVDRLVFGQSVNHTDLFQMPADNSLHAFKKE